MATKTHESVTNDSSRRERSRLQMLRANSSNAIRPSPALVSWIDRAVSRFTSEVPWTYADASTASRAMTPVATGERRAGAAPPKAVPDDVRERFVRVGRDYYFPSGAKAFRDHGQKVTTPSENTEVIGSIVEIAIARDWRDVTVTGSKRFRKEAWRVATIAGLVVRGYRPSEFEKQKLVRDLAAARLPHAPVEPLVDVPRSKSPAKLEEQGVLQRQDGEVRDSGNRLPIAAEKTGGPVARGSDSEKLRRTYSGTLVEHAPATYQFHPHGEPSCFMRLQTRRGVELLWGKDFERALTDAQVNTGDEIRVQQAGYKTVTVKHKERDASGRITEEHDIKARRNQWEVRSEDGRLPEATANQAGESPPLSIDVPTSDARKSPIVDGAVRALKGAQLFAERRIADPQQRSAFVNAVRVELLQMLDRGEVPVAERRSGQAATKYREPRTLS